MAPAKPVSLDGVRLTPADLERVARFGAAVSLSAGAGKRIARSAGWVARLARRKAPTYGITTGLGSFVHRRVDPSQAAELSRNLILSHAAGTGPAFDKDVVRGAMVIRLNTFAKGHSGVRAEIARTLLSMLNRGVTPWIPSQGSLGASGDLAPLAHLALSFTTESSGPSHGAQAWFDGSLVPAAEALRRAGIPPVRLAAKEGLSLTNGPAFSAALFTLAVTDAERLFASAEVACAMTLEALGARSACLDPRLHQARGHAGQIAVARQLRLLTRGSDRLDRKPALQDPYSLRCAAQILGPAREAIRLAALLARNELNAATDNPLLFDGEAVSGGNFHGAALAYAADTLKIAMTTIGSLAERQVNQLVDSQPEAGLPAMLVGKPGRAGLQSGMMMLQYTAASLALENQSLATPNSVHSLPTSAGQEDLNPNAATAARHLARVVENVRSILGIHLLAAAQALDLVPGGSARRMGSGVRRAHGRVRARVPFLGEDAALSPLFEALALMLKTSDWLP